MIGKKRIFAGMALALSLLAGGCATGRGQVRRANADGQLKLGMLVPLTGDLAALGPPQQLGYQLAVKEINDAGGVLGKPVLLLSGDDGTNEQIANATVDQHLRDNVDAILGAASSRVTLSIIDKVTGSQVVECSPSNTGAGLSTYEKDLPGYYFRTAPPDSLQGPALAQLIVGDGFSRVGIIALNDEYGQGFARFLSQGLQSAGATVVANVAYDPSGTEFSADVQKLVDARPAAVAVLGFPDTGSKVLREMLNKGLAPGRVGVYTADGMQSDELPRRVDPNNPRVLDRVKGTAPSSQGSAEFTQKFKAFAPQNTATTYSAHAYDCVNIIALAVLAANSDDPSVFRQQIVGVTRDGEKCSTFAACSALLRQGRDIDYEGAAGPLDFAPPGEPSAGTYEIWQFEDGKIKTLTTTNVRG